MRKRIDISEIKEKRDLVDRVANSPTFQRSPRLREFLIYVADCTIDERLEGVREQQIAAHVFNRKPDYNAGTDNIVRVEARSLRKRLEGYFAADGKDEPVIISMPKGSYSVCFEPRIAELDSAPSKDAEQIAPLLEPATAKSRWMVPFLLAVIVILAATVAFLWLSTRSTNATSTAPHTLILPFSGLVEATKDTYIVTGDSSLVLIEELQRRQVSLDDYITGRYLADTKSSDPVRQDLIRLLLQRRYTSVPETGIAMQILQKHGWAISRLFIRSGHGVQLSNFKNNNVILFGSVASNPWTALFSEKLNFQFEWDQSRRGMFRNRSPRPGEKPLYSMTTFRVRAARPMR